MEVFNMEMIKNIPAVYFFKYHHGHKELKGTHMCFFDDLMVLCNGDKVSLNVVMKSHEEFNNVFGLFPNMNKSIIFFGSLNDERRNEILDVLPFKIRKLPMKYLGVPLISKTLGINEFFPTISQRKDYVVWIDDSNKEVEFSVISNAWKSLRDKWLKVVWKHVVWFSRYTPKHDFILWLAIQGRSASGCKSLESVVISLAAHEVKNNIWQTVNKLVLRVTVYFIWNERNKRIFKDETRTEDGLIKFITKHMTDMLMSLKVKTSGNKYRSCSWITKSWSAMPF
ncbi:hypothetical protein Tco_0965026 [Tanacetum coccineum]